jgi:alkaline phosphatase
MSIQKISGKIETGFNRRTFLRTSAASAVLLGSGCWSGRNTMHASVSPEKYEEEARNVILMVSDGMSSGTLTMADLMLRRRDGRRSNWLTLYDENRTKRGLMDMASLDSIVTDSAAASASWGGGKRVNNGSLNIGPNGEEHTPVLSVFKDAGKGTGLVTTTRMTHATPAGFAANVPSRAMEDEIAVQYYERKIDVLFGGGSRHFDKDRRADGRDLFDDFAQTGYHVVRHKKDLFNIPADRKPALGIFFEDHVPYTLDHINIPEYRESVPTLAEMTQIALNRLSRDPNGFILQVEGGRVDHAAHGNDVGGLIYDQIAFDDAIGVVLEFAENNHDTLLIITTDHGNANPGLNGAGSGYRDSNTNFDSIQNFTYTNNWILGGLSKDSTTAQVRERVEAATRHQITVDEAQIVIDAYNRVYHPVYKIMWSPYAVLGQILANYTSVNWIGDAHTADYVELTALGPGSESIGSFVKNTDLFTVMVESAGVRVADR